MSGNSTGARPSDQALVSDGAAKGVSTLTGFDPSRFAADGFYEFGKISLDKNGEMLGLVHGLRAEFTRRGFRCGWCGHMQHAGSWLVWVPNGLRKDDPNWAFEDASIFCGQSSGTGWCLKCAPKDAKATPTRSAKTTQIGLVRRMVARCRKAFAHA